MEYKTCGDCGKQFINLADRSTGYCAECNEAYWKMAHEDDVRTYEADMAADHAANMREIKREMGM